MIAPLTPYTIRGVIWYQGESNAGRAYQYRRLFPALIRDWRRAWGLGDFPFLFVQLANFRAIRPEPSESAWAELREAQLMALSLPRTGMAVAIDVGEADDIHPKNKQEVGRRLALAARAIAYGEDLVYSGPLYDHMRIEGDRIRLWFQPRIEGDTVVVWSPEVPNPVAVRYAWADNPVCNLYNRAGLPASPFRTDAWPGITASNR
jgi:sialate O-acetylesterase